MSSLSSTSSIREILVVEDEPSINDIVSTALRHQGHSVVSVHDGQAALESATATSFDLIVLDVMLPLIDGFDVCRRLRESGSSTRVLFLSARHEPESRVRGFMMGGDDYLTKPFSIDELILRVAAILRRSPTDAKQETIRVGDLVMDPAALDVRRGPAVIDLSQTEFRLLHYLMVNVGVVVSKSQILHNVWNYDYDGSENVVEVYIGYLRRKIDAGHAPLIHTKRGAGYMLREASA